MRADVVVIIANDFIFFVTCGKTRDGIRAKQLNFTRSYSLLLIFSVQHFCVGVASSPHLQFFQAAEFET